jgi:hypothetical protein
MDFLPQAFAGLARYEQFIIYKILPSKDRPGKNDKIPIDPFTGLKLAWSKSANWMDFESAARVLKNLDASYGVGFILTEKDPFFFLDIDSCLDINTNSWSDNAKALCSFFPGAAIEISSSGKGLHILGTLTSKYPHGCRSVYPNIELYTSSRFVALTGTGALGSVDTDCTAQFIKLVDAYFTKENSKSPSVVKNGPVEQWNGPTDDDVLIGRMLKSHSSKNIFGGGASFKDLWENNVESFSRNYPDDTRAYNESSVDAALAQHLAFWTGNDEERMQRLMLRSGLVREKWEREDYLPRTIASACSKQHEWLTDKNLEPITVKTENQGARVVSGNTFLTLEQQMQIFSGCTYITDSHQILIPGGYTLNQERFKVVFGGYSFPMDAENTRVVRNAWEAFTESQILRHPRADGSTFKPSVAPGSIIEKDGRRFVNTYWPVQTKRAKGDASPMLKHLDKIFGNERDVVIILSYFSAALKYIGTKFSWCPFIQGVEGNGKSLLSQCMEFAIGERYFRYPRASEIQSRFNSWIYGSIFVAIEDLYDGNREVIEVMKPMITGTRQEIEPKGQDKVTQDICCNFLINTNHKSGLLKYRNDRRFAPFYTVQQNVEDLKKSGMDGDYFYDLFDWLNRDGFAIFADYLENYDIPEEFNPATKCKRAPITNSTEEAIEHGRSVVEQEILECIEQGQLGFKNGWISSIQLDSLLTRLKANVKVPLNKRRELLNSIGYDWHPGLKEGRVNNPVAPDGGKPRLFVCTGHHSLSISSAAEIGRAYSEAQSS